MKTHWKILLTFGVLSLFILVLASLVVLFTTGFDGAPALGRGYVAVIPIKGEITFGDCGGSLLSAPVACANVDAIKNSIKDAEEDWTVNAILLDINSGGGSVVATRELNYAVKNSEKPVVAYIGEIGASGSYYVASSARKIVADRNSITGGIGVRMDVMQYYGLMDKLGVNVTTIKAGETKDVGSPYRPMTDKEREELQDIINKIYDEFIATVAENRNLDVEYVRSVSDGRIYLGVDAKELKLVDELGSFDYAVDVAAIEGGIEGEPKVKNLVPSNSIRSLFAGQVSDGVIYDIVEYLV